MSCKRMVGGGWPGSDLNRITLRLKRARSAAMTAMSFLAGKARGRDIAEGIEQCQSNNSPQYVAQAMGQQHRLAPARAKRPGLMRPMRRKRTLDALFKIILMRSFRRMICFAQPSLPGDAATRMKSVAELR